MSHRSWVQAPHRVFVLAPVSGRLETPRIRDTPTANLPAVSVASCVCGAWSASVLPRSCLSCPLALWCSLSAVFQDAGERLMSPGMLASHTLAPTNRQLGDLSPCGQSPMDFESITLATRSNCLMQRLELGRPVRRIGDCVAMYGCAASSGAWLSASHRPSMSGGGVD